MAESIVYETSENGFGLLTINRPEKRNAISTEMSLKFHDALLEAKKNDIKFLVITGAGDRMFCAGGDLRNLHGELSPNEAYSSLHPMKQVLFEIVTFPVPVICLLNGDALGGGCEIATACDLRIARDGTKFGFVQSTIGILPGWGGGSLLHEKVLSSFALQWLMEGQVYEASFLEQKGWIHKLVENEQWAIDQLVKPYTSRSLAQMRLLKEQYIKKLSTGKQLSELMDEDVQNCAALWDSTEHIEAVQKFLSRRKK